jgi:exodeoxyribonuclease V alpha subunit
MNSSLDAARMTGRGPVFQGCLRLTTIRWRSESSAICGAVLINADGSVASGHTNYSVKIPTTAQAAEPRPGQHWRVLGTQSSKQYERGHFLITEIQVLARTAELHRPAGDHIVQMMARSEDFPGVGQATAAKLWDAFGDELYEILDDSDEERLTEVIGAKLAAVVLDGWRLFGASDALQWLHRSGFDVRLSRTMLDVYGNEVRQKLEEDPYRALAFGMSWIGVDQLARNIFTLQPDDPRRLAAAIESALYEAMDDGGHAALPRTTVLATTSKLIGQQLAQQATAIALAQGTVVQSVGDLLALPGMEIVEGQIASRLLVALREPALCDDATVVAVTRKYEIETAAELGESFGLNDAQREAVLGVAKHAALLITGGAGVGKTTVLRAIVTLLEHCEFPFRVMTIAGRAARRAAEATGRPASTIAGYLRSVSTGKESVDTPFALIVDEASMLDVLHAWRLLQTLPQGSRIILIGDPGQLPPVGPGLTLHAMVGTCIPYVELTQARRFGGEIAEFSRCVRAGEMPEVRALEGQAVMATAVPRQLVVGAIVDLFLQDPGNTQVLAFNREGDVSCSAINQAVQRRLVGAAHSLSADEARIGIKIENEDGRLEYAGLRCLDRVICNVNLYDEGLQNGSLGQIVEVHSMPVMRSTLGKLAATQVDELVFAEVLWDDAVRRPVTLAVIDALELAYCITTHKAQGSQFARVVVACSRGSLLDRAIIYTAITRATKAVVLLGDIEAVTEAVARPPKATERVTTLGARLRAE